jgi:preprotein translocase SecE subunit
MAVAEKTVAEKALRSPQHQLALKSFFGAIYVLFSLGMIFSGLPVLWGEIFKSSNEFLSGALLLMIEAVAVVVFLLVGRAMEKQNPPHGLRAGIFFVCVAVLVICWIALWFASLLERAEMEGAVPAILTLAVAAGLVFAASRIFVKPGCARWLGDVEDQGWFHASPYKANQGVRVRRGTMLALMTLGICGIITLISHNALGSSRHAANDWEVIIPFTETASEILYVPLLFHIEIVVPLILLVLLVWMSWRVVSWPLFADFLIATEAEMNKVSWTTRRRLFQDTIVVLVAVVLLTAYLFVVDIMWIKVLSWDVIHVLRVDVRAEQLKQQEKSPW